MTKIKFLKRGHMSKNTKEEIVEIVKIAESKSKTNPTTKRKNTSNRIGASFEHDIQRHCDELNFLGKAVINKVPVEWTVVRGSYGKIVKAFCKEKSKFVDFCGITNKGRAISIEAKSTTNKTSFPFANIEDYQVEFLDRWVRDFKGIGFYLIRFSELKRLFLVPALTMSHCINNIGRKSAPLSWFEKTPEVVELDYYKINFEDVIKNSIE